ncbi:MAG: hypothetical protein H7Y27_09720 [Gemmatimonadaceae bacterium]|nr:hypothetical protein [Chitinophagaceae bacterium]
MARQYSNFATPEVISLLDTLADEHTDVPAYKDALYLIGTSLGQSLLTSIQNRDRIMLVSTVEDTDHLGKGILDRLESAGKTVFLTVFWNKRASFGKDFSVAPIIKEFHEKGDRHNATLIILKSIISSSCVIRTNLTRVFEETTPSATFIVAPVLMKGSRQSLEAEFDRSISSRFNYVYFAEDDERTIDGIVIPGVGGDIYKRLGFGDQDGKNKFTPALVKKRRLSQQIV